MKPVTPFCIARLRICCCCYMEGFPSPNVSMETPPKSTLAGEVVSLLSQDHRLPAFWCRHMIWPTACQPRLDNSSEAMRWFVQDIVLPQPSALIQGFPTGMLGYWSPQPWQQLRSQIGPVWLDQLLPFTLCTVQIVFSRCALILKRLWSCCVTLFSWDPSLPPVLAAAPILLRTEKFRMVSYWSSSLLVPGWDLWSGKAPFCVSVLTSLLP